MNRSSTPKTDAPTKTAKPKHVPGQGVADMTGVFAHDGPAVKTPHMPMFAPVAGPRLTPEEAPGAPEGWQPHRPSRPANRTPPNRW